MLVHPEKTVVEKVVPNCYHCGLVCQSDIFYSDEKSFCCEGCRVVYDLLKDNNLCTYYNLNKSPGTRINPGAGKFEFLNNEEIKAKLIKYTDGIQSHVTFYIPKIHCSSCIWLLENLNRINPGILSSTVNFIRKEVTIIFNAGDVSLSQIAVLLVLTGYEPLINLDAVQKNKKNKNNHEPVIKIGLAGFCFGNIMMLSFPEYFSMGEFQGLQGFPKFVGWLNLTLSLPVFFYCASGFFKSAFKSIRFRYLNIDAPIALAIAVTFFRSVYEITSGNGAGYLDSMSGIVFFMLIGRYFQDKTYESLSFDRDYRSYFPLGVTIRNSTGDESSLPATQIKTGDKIIIRHQEVIPADSILDSEFTHIDYSFITGESSPVRKQKGDLIYAGGKQINGAAEYIVSKPVSQSYLTGLWDRESGAKRIKTETSYAASINKYFTITVLLLSFLTFIYWSFYDISTALNAFTAILIVACPCGLLLTTTFCNANMLRIFGNNKLYLKNASVIDSLSNTTRVIFDKTGTLTHGTDITFHGKLLSNSEENQIYSLSYHSSHPLSRAISNLGNTKNFKPVIAFEEVPGKGIRGYVDNHYIIAGNEEFVLGRKSGSVNETRVYIMIDGNLRGYYSFSNTFRPALSSIIKKLQGYKPGILSGDNESEKESLLKIFGTKSDLLFNCSPDDKLNYIKSLQHKGENVLMIGDGLNDAAALLASDTGIAVSDDSNKFSPACDAILEGSAFEKIPDLIRFAKAGKQVILIIFAFSLIYNIAGLYFAVRGMLMPVIAAILMPLSSISIIALSALLTRYKASKHKLQ